MIPTDVNLFSDEIAVAIIGVIGLILLAVFAWITQGRVKALRDELTAVEQRVDGIEADLRWSQTWSRTLEDYARRLRIHIDEGLPPPPPPWPQPPAGI